MMRDYQLVTDADLVRARDDAAFRQRLLANNLDRLLVELNRLRTGTDIDRARVLQMREGAQLAVRLADLLHEAAKQAEARAKGA